MDQSLIRYVHIPSYICQSEDSPLTPVVALGQSLQWRRHTLMNKHLHHCLVLCLLDRNTQLWSVVWCREAIDHIVGINTVNNTVHGVFRAMARPAGRMLMPRGSGAGLSWKACPSCQGIGRVGEGLGKGCSDARRKYVERDIECSSGQECKQGVYLRTLSLSGMVMGGKTGL